MAGIRRWNEFKTKEGYMGLIAAIADFKQLQAEFLSLRLCLFVDDDRNGSRHHSEIHDASWDRISIVQWNFKRRRMGKKLFIFILPGSVHVNRHYNGHNKCPFMTGIQGTFIRLYKKPCPILDKFVSKSLPSNRQLIWLTKNYTQIDPEIQNLV
ncbi:hypothetical protein NC653_010030 [Populus alba x Populus x berolinensis]|uniref:Uncharacterized protein n=1 Tax=Populus alba x Populus x berolinensis TaxID=444605 RepID=A0AAD6WAL7_9ROSI|nr:hypothetical protein NC653_010030 [Populus alba x Populus x berolinensis]